MVNLLPRETQDEIVVMLVQKNKEKILELITKLAKECGCKFTFGSDAHDNKQHDFYGNAQILADILELKENDLAEICR
jgi:histidinol phosphatase-like PHP family hydrolase